MTGLRGLFAVLSAMALATSAIAADKAGSFALKGAGLASCTRFVEALQSESREALLFAGWVHGYLTAMNEVNDQTYDLLPWQQPNMVLLSLDQYCRANPELRFFQAVAAMRRSLESQRLTEQSDLIEIPTGGKRVRLYRTTIEKLQIQLAELGHDGVRPTGEFDEVTRAALIEYQRDRNLPATGWPDQNTLKSLFY